MYGCTYKAKWTNGCSLFFSSLLFVIMLISWCAVGGVKASSDASLSISISLVEGDTFGPGDSFHVIVEIRNREAQGRVDVIVTYEVLDWDENIILSDSKTVAVETKSSFAEEFDLPAWTDEGAYVLMANVSTLDGGQWSEASRSFSVVRITGGDQRIIEYVLVVALVFTGGALVYEHRRISKLKVSGRDLKKFIGGQKKK